MNGPSTARELWPLIQRLRHEERLILAKLALRSVADQGDDEVAYAHIPVGTDEFRSADETLACDAEGWQEFNPRVNA